MFINDIDISKSSEDFIHFILDEDSMGTKINAGKTAKVNVLPEPADALYTSNCGLFI